MPTPLPPQRLAFIGGYGHHYLRGAIEDATIDVEAVAIAPDRCDAEATRRKFQRELEVGAVWYDDPLAMLDTFNATAVNIGGVYAHDAPLTLAALERDLPVVAEKPIAVTWDEYHALCEALRRPGRILLTEFNFRSAPAFRAAREAVRAGHLGTPVLATAQKSYRFGERRPDFYKRREDYGSTLLWVASHGLDAIHFTTGQAFTNVCGHHGNLARPEYEQMEDHVAAVYTMSDGGTAVVHGDLLRPAAAKTHGDDRLRVVGSRGLIEIRDHRCLLTTHDQPERDITDDLTTSPIHHELLEALQQRHGDGNSEHPRGNDIYNTTDALAMAAALLAGRDACDQGQVVTIAPVMRFMR